MTRVMPRPPTVTDRDAFTAAMRASRDHHRPWIKLPDLSGVVLI